jgi:actin, other eukaryote
MLKPVVIDAGSDTIKSGIGGNSLPTSIIPSIVGTKTFKNEKKELFIGKKFSNLEDIVIQRSIEFRHITNWDRFEELLNFIFYQELKISPDEHPIFMSKAISTPPISKEKMIELVFETFNSPGFYMSLSSILALYSSGNTSGTVLDSGFQETHSCPIYEGIPFANLRNCFGGKDVTENLKKQLTEKNNPLSFEIVDDIKENLCFFQNDLQEKMEKIYTLPDGSIIKLEHEMMEITSEKFSFDELIFNSIKKCELDFQRDFFSKILICGGNTMFPGLEKKIFNGMLDLVSNSTKNCLKFVPCDRMYSTWIGGSISSSVTSLQSTWINSEDYKEKGAIIVHTL